MTHTIEITDVPDDLLKRLDERIQENGIDRSRYIREVIEKELREEARQKEPTFREIFAPAQAGFDQMGMTDEELSDFLEDEIRTYRAERRAREQNGVLA